MKTSSLRFEVFCWIKTFTVLYFIRPDTPRKGKKPLVLLVEVSFEATAVEYLKQTGEHDNFVLTEGEGRCTMIMKMIIIIIIIVSDYGRTVTDSAKTT
ncbi:MAG: hypothetical protein BWY80_00042 [Firmicutes bacterium ADurb.Bin456]|nr:MAG: hypothetical protein BWY80_00042 [Firmicutes bacterium ADurb.Bin456]